VQELGQEKRKEGRIGGVSSIRTYARGSARKKKGRKQKDYFCGWESSKRNRKKTTAKQEDIPIVGRSRIGGIKKPLRTWLSQIKRNSVTKN